MISHLFLDCSGVLSNDEEPVYQTNVRVAKIYGKEYSPRATWKDLASNTVGAMRAIGIDAPSEEIYAHFRRIYREVVESGVRPYIYPDVPGTLARLKEKGKKLVVISSHPQTELIEDLGELACYFDLISGEHDGYKRKAEAIRSFALEGRTAYVGDMSFDIKAGREAGVMTIGLITGYHTRSQLAAENPDLILEKFSDLLLLA